MIRRFNRSEMKVLVSAPVGRAIASELAIRLVSDPMAGRHGRYRVSSLYYDTPTLDYFRSKTEGGSFRRRFKLRVRLYGDPTFHLDPIVMVELKRRSNGIVDKRRVALPLRRAYDLCDGHGGLVGDNTLDSAVASQVEFLVRRFALTPACIISYQRRALVGGTRDPGVRITFDNDLACRSPVLSLDEDAPLHSFLPSEVCVMEVKTAGEVPAWIERILTDHDCHPSTFSKYGSGFGWMQAHAKIAPPRTRSAGNLGLA